MKKLFLSLLVCAFAAACCSQKHSGNSDTPAPSDTTHASTLGKVSHQYRSTGCASVVLVNWQKPEEEITLIPVDTLASQLDVDGLEIYFNYQPLKRPNPAGCSAGNPAKLTDITRK